MDRNSRELHHREAEPHRHVHLAIWLWWYPELASRLRGVLPLELEPGADLCGYSGYGWDVLCAHNAELGDWSGDGDGERVGG